MLNRAIWLAVLASAVVTVPAVAQEKTVNVYNWSDYIDESVLADFTKETGIKVVYDTFDSNEVLETKLLTGNSGYDVVFPTVSFMPRQIKAGALQKLDRSKISNWNNYSTEIAQRSAIYDPGNEYGATYMWFPTGVGYNVAKVKERLGDQPMNTWDVIFNPEKLSKLKDCGVYFLDSPEDIMTAALKYLGKDPNTRDVNELQEAGTLIGKVRPFVKKFHSSEYINALANGDICVAVGWAGDVYQAKDRASEAGKGVEVSFAVPKEGTLVSMDTMAVPADAKNVDNAHAFINFMLRPDIAARNTNATNFANSVLSSKDKVKDEIKNDPAIYLSAEALAGLYTVQPYDQKLQRSVTRLWTKVKSGR
jgi:putrescine transport system substrate-binding protein